MSPYALVVVLAASVAEEVEVERPPLALMDAFEFEYASDPQLSPDGVEVVYVRNSMDRMKDRVRRRLWRVGVDGEGHRPLSASDESASMPRWSSDGTRLAYVVAGESSSELRVRWMDGGEVARLADLPRSPADVAWSRDGRWLAFTMAVPTEVEKWLELPAPPEGAEWAPPPKLIEETIYREDGAGYREPHRRHVFVVPADGGTPRQVTSDDRDYASPAWSHDGMTIFAESNRREHPERFPLDTEIVAIEVATGRLTDLTSRDGPDRSPVVSPDGSLVAYVGFDDEVQGYQLARLYVVRTDGSDARCLTAEFDRAVEGPRWRPDGAGIYVQFSSRGNTRVGYLPLEGGEVTEVATGLGGTTLGRPYGGGSYSVAAGVPFGAIAYTHTTPSHPSDVAVATQGGDARRVTRLNDDLLSHRTIGGVEEIVFPSSHDGREIQGWLMKPPGFDPSVRYPLLLEIHGGPFADYGDRFSCELQLFAARGYVVLYLNPRGSSSYGQEFGNLIHHRYPGDDYFDLMSGVDAVLERGYVDEERLFVTGGSGGGVLTAWIVGRTNRFRAAVVCKPVIHWTSFVLTADRYPFFTRYWFPAAPWDDPMHYWERSPLALVGAVETPTMLLTGEADYRTPMSESEQYYQALRLRGVDTALVRIPEASHGIAARPGNLVRKVASIVSWFERYDER